MSNKIDQFDDGVSSLVEETLPAEPPDIAGRDAPEPRLGPFALEEQIGEGGSGVVWRGRHLDQGLPVAVKFITKLGDNPDNARRRFRSEVRSVAALNHPGIVTVLDYGETDAEFSHRLGGQIPSGIPFMITEFARAGTLIPFMGEVDWPFCRGLLLALLDALAHAHARDVIHRDIKPTNVLIDQGPAQGMSTVTHTDLDDDALRIKLTDFGIAFRRDRALDPTSEAAEGAATEGAVGTPYYMAPEQLQARWRDYGPWSDLYAVGCMAWQLITGRRPFSGDSLMAVARAQLVEPLPAFEPRFEVPDRLINWLVTMTRKRPGHRFRSAADAAAALTSLDDSREPADRRVRLPGHLLQTPDASFPAEWKPALETLRLDFHQTDDELDLPAGFPTPADDGDGRGHSSANRQPPPLRRRHPPLPDHWARQGATQPPMTVVGAGLRLFGLRDFPVVGHREARDRLWAGLPEAIDGTADDQRPSPRLIFLHGPAGIGKSRLARWLVHRAREVGAANAMRASHDKTGQTPIEALRAMVDRYLGCVGLSHDETRRRIAKWYDQRGITGRDDGTHYEVDALADLLAPDDAHGSGGGEIRMQEAFGILQAFVQRAAGNDRPLILHLDDVHWGRETLEWVRRMLEGPGGSPTRAPILMVATYRDESLAERPREAELVEELTGHEAASSVELDPLSPRHLRKLMESGLRLKPELGFKVLDRADGNPLFATQLVQTWADRELLEVGDGGFRLKESAEDLLPDDLYEVWSERLDRALGDAARDQYLALELGATLGREPHRDEWQAACQRAGVPFPEALVERLLKNRLLEDTDTGWRFAHNMLRETLERHSRRGGRWRRHNRACADVVRALGDGPDKNNGQKHTGEGTRSQRLAEFLLEAQDWEAAIEPLLEAIEHHGRMGRLDAAGYLLERLEEAMQKVDLEEGDERMARYHLRKGRFALAHLRDLDLAAEHFREILSASPDSELGSIRSRALSGLARVAYHRQNLDAASEYLHRALCDCPENNDALRGRIHREIGTTTFAASDSTTALEHLNRASILLRGNPIEEGKVKTELGRILLSSGNKQSAYEALEEGLKIYREFDCFAHQATTLNTLAAVYRERDEYGEAIRCLTEAEQFARTFEPSLVPYIQIGRVEVNLDKENFQEASEQLKELEERLPALLKRLHRLYRFVASIGLAQWDEAQEHLTRLEDIWDGYLEGTPEGIHFLHKATSYLAESQQIQLHRRLTDLLE